MSSWNVNDQRIPQGRLTLFSYLSVAFVIFLLIGFWKLQVIQSDHYADLAQKNGIRSIPIIAPRGPMLDRNGRVLVDSYPSFSVLLLRDNPKIIEKYLPQIEEGLNISPEDMKEQIEAARSEPRFMPVIIKSDASQADIAFVESHRIDIPVLDLMTVQRRHYPYGDMLANAIGYVGEVSPKELAGSDGRYKPGDIVGKAGLEKEYNHELEGTDGMRRVVVDSVGKVVRTLDNIPPVPGKPIQLTIDYNLQQVVEHDMDGKEGAVVAMDARTGAVLAMVSRPTFNPNDFAAGISPREWKKLNNDPETPLLNRAIQAQLAPGSVFKIVMATAMLESKAIPANYTVYCPGYAIFYGHLFHCDHPHGEVNLHKAIVVSCDVYFYNVGKLLGINRIAYYANALGLGHLTGIDLPGEEPGLVPSETWVERVYHHKWYPGSTISVAIGQGAVEATPIQLARMVAGVASGGMLAQPHLLKDDPNVKTTRFPISENTVQQVTEGMWGVVNEPDGTTAEQVKLKNIQFCGKTGTAQTMSYAEQKRLGVHLKENGWFVGYAPRVNPEIVVAALVQKGVWGSTSAAPIVRDVVKAYYDEKNGQTPQVSTAQNTPKPGASHSLVATGTGVPSARQLGAGVVDTGVPSAPASRAGVQTGAHHQ